MAICVPCLLVWASVVGFLLFLLVRFALYSDSDFTLQWLEWRGRKPEEELPGKVVWITGASSGIGEEMAFQLAKIGSRLALSARRENELERVKKKCLEIGQLSDTDILIVPLDLTQRGTHEPATSTVLKHFGKIDVLVNSGGRAQLSLFVNTNIDVYNAIMELNYLGTISLTKPVLNHMIERKQGKVVTISSGMGLMGAPLATGYCASKHALMGFFNSLRPELTEYPDISVINICPGPVQSQVIQNVFTEEVSKKNVTIGDQSHKMTTERCVRLTLVSLVNNLKEAWISDQPYLVVYYLWQYTPTWAWWLMNLLGPKRIQNFESGLEEGWLQSKRIYAAAESLAHNFNVGCRCFLLQKDFLRWHAPTPLRQDQHPTEKRPSSPASVSFFVYMCSFTSGCCII